MRDFHRTLAWKKADALVEIVYQVARSLPPEERFGLSSQLRRAAVSVAANIAEGAGRSSDAEFERFLSIASGSASELKYHLEVVGRLWPSPQAVDALARAAEVKKMLWALRRASRGGRD